VTNQSITRVTGYTPVLMSLIALAVVWLGLVEIGFDPARYPKDEGSAAHIWQLLMGLQLPIILLFYHHQCAIVHARYTGVGTAINARVSEHRDRIFFQTLKPRVFADSTRLNSVVGFTENGAIPSSSITRVSFDETRIQFEAPFAPLR